VAADAEQRAVAAEHDRHVGLAGHFFGRQGRVILDADVQRRFALEHDVVPARGDARRQFHERCGNVGGRVAADQRDGLERRGLRHAGS